MSNLAIQKRLLKTIASDAPRSTHQERQSRAALVAVVVAIHNRSLDGLLQAVTPFLRGQITEIDAMKDGEMFDLASLALIEAGIAEDVFADMNDLSPIPIQNSERHAP